VDVTFLRYGRWNDCSVYVREVDPRQVEQAIVGDAAPSESKDHYLEKRREKSTPAASDAFDTLRREMEGLGFIEKITGKGPWSCRPIPDRADQIGTPSRQEQWLHTTVPQQIPEGCTVRRQGADTSRTCPDRFVLSPPCRNSSLCVVHAAGRGGRQFCHP